MIKNNEDTKPIETPDKTEEYKQSMCSSFFDRFKHYRSPLTTLVVNYYSPFLQNYIVKLIIIVLFSIWFGFCVWGCTSVEDGLNTEDVLPAGTAEHDFVSANVEHFAAYSFRVVTKDIDYKNRNVQRALIQLSEQTKIARYAVDAGGFTAYWLTLMTQYFAGVDYTYCTRLNITQRMTTFADMTQALVGIYLSLNFTEYPPNILLQYIVACNETLTGLPRLVEYDQHGVYIPEDRFYWYIPIWVSKHTPTIIASCTLIEVYMHAFICHRLHWIIASTRWHRLHLILVHHQEMCQPLLLTILQLPAMVQLYMLNTTCFVKASRILQILKIS